MVPLMNLSGVDTTFFSLSALRCNPQLTGDHAKYDPKRKSGAMGNDTGSEECTAMQWCLSQKYSRDGLRERSCQYKGDKSCVYWLPEKTLAAKCT